MFMKSLDLSFNRIKHIRKNSFKGLNNLLFLDLSNNDLNYEHISFESAAFYFLEKLKSLNLKRNVNSSFVPDLSKLQSLETLSMDFISDNIAILDEKFVCLKNLTFIDLSGVTGNCKMNTPCKIQYIYNGTLTNMRNMSELDVSLNTCLGFPALENITTDIMQSAIKVLKVNYIYGIFEMTSVLKYSHIRNLQNTSLIRFEAAGNRIKSIESGALRYLPKSLESVDLRDNVFSVGQYLNDLKTIHITSIDISHTYSTHNMLTTYLEMCIPREYTVTINSQSNWLYKKITFFESMKKRLIIPVPPKLRTFLFRSSRLKYEIPYVRFTKNELNNLSFSDNTLHRWTGPIRNVKQLTSLDLSSNTCSNVSKLFFSKDFSMLKNLLLHDNNLGQVIAQDNNGEILKNLNNVVYINLSKNKIKNIPNLFFKKQHNLKHLDLNENMIKDITFKVSHMNKLVFLNLRNNHISKLSKYALNALDSVAKTSVNFTIDLRGNNIFCNCDSISFVKWMVNTPTHLHGLKKYECKMPNNTQIFIHNPRQIFKTLQKECMSYEGIIIGITTGILIFIFILCGGISYRFKWKLRYLYYMVKVKWHQTDKESDNKDERVYMYDVFVSYADEDQTFVHNILVKKLEKDGGIQLCLHKRNFLPGNDIATNITSAIHNSRKTMVIMSPYYLASYWCMFEYNMARMEGIYERDYENILFLVFYKQISTCDLPLQILELVQCQSYIEYPNDEYGDVVFWEQLKRAIQSC
ncbi:toll-like receptor 4 [Mytilus trossulus]|uniref:toll-like receptor 4 n=1 Tax=Mytilus trossulus TaxID=6551 RepID=UPI003004AEED